MVAAENPHSGGYAQKRECHSGSLPALHPLAYFSKLRSMANSQSGVNEKAKRLRAAK
jgi:hypothetical protein